MNAYTHILTGCILGGVLAPGLGADAPRPDSPPASSAPTLDELLLDDLGGPTAQSGGSVGAPAAAPQRTPADESSAAEAELDRRLRAQQPPGEDLGAAAEDPYRLIGKQMRQAEALIAQGETAEKTQQVQQQIVEDLARLIETMKQQCAGGACDKPGQGKPSPGKPSSGSKTGSGENQGTNKPAKDSNPRVGPAAADQAELDRLQAMLKRVWGHLPPRLREQLQSGLGEEFLPKYEKLIEEYYQRLVEERN
jgi:hypothetical protein